MIACNRLFCINRRLMLVSVCIMTIFALLAQPAVNSHAIGPDRGPDPGPDPGPDLGPNPGHGR